MDLAVALIFTVLILVGLYLTSRIDLAFSSDLETFSGPRAYPGTILSILLLFNLMIVVSQVRSVVRNTDLRPDRQRSLPTSFVQAAGLFVALVAFVLAFEPVGYILTMVPLLTISARLCGARSTINAFVVSMGLAAICLIVFRYGLATVLPEGVFGIDMLL
jgi:hypothetical protein